MRLSAGARAFLAVAALCAISPAVAAGPAQSWAGPGTTYIAPASGPNMLGTWTVAIRAARFNGSWANAMQDATHNPLLLRMVAAARGMPALQQMQFVQSRVNNAIRWMSDATQWGQHDYWASANQTLRSGAGDMEDRAIVKMQALRALGFSPNDLWLTLARDAVGGPVTVLTVRLGGRYYILDDTGGEPFLVESRRREFQPLLSFGWNGAWVHTQAPAMAFARTASAPASGR
jgi:predicted transglutaminase-like cysteine proteinase